MTEAPTFADDMNLADYFLFDRLKEGRGAHPAIRFGGRTWSYDEVADRSARLASVLIEAGVHPGERVLVVLPDVPPFAWSIFGILRAGAVLAMGNPDVPIGDLEYLLGYTGAAALITIPRVAAALASAITASQSLRTVLIAPEAKTGDDPETAPGAASIPRGRALATAIAEAKLVDPPPTHRDDVAIWLFTSGSTGKSKAAIHTHRDFAFNTELYAKRTVGYRADDRTVSVSRLFFGYATGTNLFFPFAVGATSCLFSERPTPESLVAAIEAYRPTVITNVPTMLGKLLEHDAESRKQGRAGLDLASIRFQLSAGEALPASLLGKWKERFGHAEIYDGIGSAEMFHIYISNRPGDIKAGSLGKLVDGYEAKVLPRDAEGPGAPEVPTGEWGVLWIAGDSVAMGYHRDRDKSFATFVGRWCNTGDLFRRDADGYFWFGGRADDLLKVGGLWVSPIEVEECLMAHPHVALAAVIGAIDPSAHEAGDGPGMQKPKAFVVPTAEGRALGPALVETLQAHVKARLAKHKYPRWIELSDDLPKNDRGKVDKKALRARERSS